MQTVCKTKQKALNVYTLRLFAYYLVSLILSHINYALYKCIVAVNSMFLNLKLVLFVNTNK